MRNLIVLFFLFTCALLSYTDREILSLVIDFVKLDMHISNYQFALLIGTFFGVIYAVMGLPVGWLVDRLPRKPFLIAAIGLWSAGTIVCGLAMQFPLMLAGRMLVASGEAALAPVALSLIGDIFPRHQQGRALGFYFSGIVAGGGVSIIVGGWLLGPAGGALLAPFMPHLAPWRRIFMFLGMLGMAMCVLALFVVREPLRTHAATVQDRPDDAPEPLSTRMALFMTCLAVSAISIIDNAVGAWAPYVMVHAFNVSAAHIGKVLGWFLIVGGLMGVSLGGQLSDRLMKTREQGLFYRSVIVLLLVLAGLGMGGDLYGYGLTLCMMTGIVALAGMCSTLGLNLILYLGTPQRRGFMTSFSFFLNVLVGAGLGPLLVPLALDAPLRLPPIAALGSVATVAALVAGGLFGVAQRLSRTKDSVQA
ncbi:MFS transporter [Komagataeibacter xylinus]|uniref:MFS transporter n=1 Tax=Komagataeibacter xylinus TaxID=28448 RepID=A0A857FU22_KOMXY|nr:MFS transporter [Komagataeibacter xylinus]QHC36004.1 MFS transporter [Komagataeibacter xylinus]